MKNSVWRRSLHSVLALGLGAFLATSALAQSAFSPIIRVNDSAISGFELTQRTNLLTVLGATGNAASLAREQLIEERLQIEAARQLGFEASAEDVDTGIAEFAGRANVTPEAFLADMAQAGVDESSVRAFVRAGLLWREVLRARFASRVQITEDDVDRAIALAGTTGGARVLLSEIILPARTPQEAEVNEARANRFSQIRSTSEFAQTARDFSASPTRADGGRMDWLQLNALPPDLRAQLLTMPPGDVTEPVRLQNAIAVFQLRSLEEVPATQPATLAIDYAELRLPGGSRTDALELAGALDTCDDMFGVARGLPADQFVREVLPVNQIPRDVAGVLASLDADEISVDLMRGTTRVIVMLCGRTSEISQGLDRADVRAQLRNQRLASYADGFLAELLADAVIVDLR
ncbi:MAG: peptidylprolyl isomerase [Pseudomonadota bacterium]